MESSDAEPRPYPWSRTPGEFGYIGDECGTAAVRCLAELEEYSASIDADPADRISWSESDLRAFSEFIEFDSGIRFWEPDPDLDGSEIGALHESVTRLHAAMPFSERERQWLRSQVNRFAGNTSGELLDVKEEVFDSGVRRVIHARELVRRWIAWREQSAEFTGQGSLEETRQLLAEIADRLLPADGWPREHLDLRKRVS